MELKLGDRVEMKRKDHPRAELVGTVIEWVPFFGGLWKVEWSEGDGMVSASDERSKDLRKVGG